MAGRRCEMEEYSREYIKELVVSALERCLCTPKRPPAAEAGPEDVPVEISARHVHLTQEAVEALFGVGYTLTHKRELSQPGQFLSGEQVRIVTAKGTMDKVSVLGPVRSAVQVELSLTDGRALGLKLPVNISGDLTGAADVVLVGPCGIWQAGGSAIAARAHIHMTPGDAQHFGVTDGEVLHLKIDGKRPICLENIVARVTDTSRLAVHIDTDEANAGAVSPGCLGKLVKGE